jgi:hypothetical protein
MLLVQECRVVALLQTHAESGAHSTHFPGVPAQMGVAAGQGVSTQLPVVEQVLSVVALEHLGGELGSQPTQRPFKQAVESATLQAAVANAPALQKRRVVPSRQSGWVSALHGRQAPS